ncbi:MAG: branched-chain amino acid transporter AzlC [Fusobacteriia bacterium 4572_132]|nr:MAG: branched-chain amino acid transporter AzlC [Fusobacteriia bacterium 4572_132]
MKEKLKKGIKEGIPIFLGYYSISMTFGIIVKTAGLSGMYAILMSMTNFTGATQFIAINMLTGGALVLNILFTTLMINARYLLMSFSFSNKLPQDLNTKTKFIIPFGITDEVFVLGMTKEKLNIDFVYGAQIISYLGWVGGTMTGILLANFIPKSLSEATTIAIYIMFLGLLLPALKNSKKIAIIVVISIILSSFFYYTPIINEFIGDWRIIITIIITSLIGAILFPIKKEEELN